ncbi:hypothetical protein C2W62_25970 [Candidatus Entotheonella serta]|nr:hypothetical protein C2W62_25970 [Candidatus Entotheonella serta]
MVDEPHGEPPCLATSQKSTAERSRYTLTERDYFLAQLADALTILNDWVYLAQSGSCRTRQQDYLGIIRDTVQGIIQLMHQYREHR